MSYCSRSRQRRFTVLDFKSWAFSPIFSNICTAHAQKWLFMNFRCKFRHHSIPRPRFSVRVQNFGDLATFSIDYCILYSECPPYFYFRFVLTYWPRKYTTCVDPQVDNSHRVWSWYDHTLPRYSVFVCWYVMWPCDLDLLTLNSCCTWRVTWLTLLPTLKTLRVSVLELWVITFPVDYH